MRTLLLPQARRACLPHVGGRRRLQRRAIKLRRQRDAHRLQPVRRRRRPAVHCRRLRLEARCVRRQAGLLRRLLLRWRQYQRLEHTWVWRLRQHVAVRLRLLKWHVAVVHAGVRQVHLLVRHMAVVLHSRVRREGHRRQRRHGRR